MILFKEHFTDAGRLKIKTLQQNMNNLRKFDNNIII
jgi:hypothetical protein